MKTFNKYCNKRDGDNLVQETMSVFQDVENLIVKIEENHPGTLDKHVIEEKASNWGSALGGIAGGMMGGVPGAMAGAAAGAAAPWAWGKAKDWFKKHKNTWDQEQAQQVGPNRTRTVQTPKFSTWHKEGEPVRPPTHDPWGKEISPETQAKNLDSLRQDGAEIAEPQVSPEGENIPRMVNTMGMMLKYMRDAVGQKNLTSQFPEIDSIEQSINALGKKLNQHLAQSQGYDLAPEVSSKSRPLPFADA
jgi:hypothetical protein